MRALRHDPPRHASSSAERKLVFSTAAKQAERLFKTSETVGYDTKPILLYYGLNQSARAIAAALESNDDDWQLQGHGITCPNLDDDPNVGELLVMDSRAKRPGAFQRLAQILRCPSIPKKVPLRELWMTLPEGLLVPVLGFDRDYAWSGAEIQRVDGNLLADELTWDAFSGRSPLANLTQLPFCLAPMNVDDALSELREHYPTLSNLLPIWDNECDTLSLGHGTEFRLILHLKYDREADSGDDLKGALNILKCGTRGYHDFRKNKVWLTPSIGRNSAPLDPLATWWAILFLFQCLLATSRPTGQGCLTSMVRQTLLRLNILWTKLIVPVSISSWIYLIVQPTCQAATRQKSFVLSSRK